MTTQYQTLLAALYAALPFVEDAESDQCYKPGVAKKVAMTIRDALAIAVSAEEPAQQDAGLKSVYDAFGIGSASRDLSTLMMNVSNVKRRSECLSAIERQFFMVCDELDEDSPDEAPQEECLMSWGVSPDAYVLQFRAALDRIRPAQQDADRVDNLSQAACDILAERRRQIEAEGWTPGHDDDHLDGALTMAAVCYAEWAHYELPDDGEKRVPINWPWAASWWKPSNRRRNLEKAGALIIAEIERLDRTATQQGGN